MLQDELWKKTLVGCFIFGDYIFPTYMGIIMSRYKDTLLANQDSMECHNGFERCSDRGSVVIKHEFIKHHLQHWKVSSKQFFTMVIHHLQNDDSSSIVIVIKQSSSKCPSSLIIKHHHMIRHHEATPHQQMSTVLITAFIGSSIGSSNKIRRRRRRRIGRRGRRTRCRWIMMMKIMMKNNDVIY